MGRGHQVRIGKMQPPRAGCHGVSPLVKLLPYADYNNLFLVPICHALLYGSVKTFLNLILPRTAPSPHKSYHVSPDHRQLLKQRSKEVLVTADFGRPFR